MTVIDVHTHIFPDHIAARAVAKICDSAHGFFLAASGTKAGLTESMRHNNTTFSVTLPVATRADQVQSINRSIDPVGHPALIPFGAMHPAYEDFEHELHRLKEQGIKGIKLHPEHQDFYIDDKRYYPLYETCADLGLCIVFHAGSDPSFFTSDHGLPAAFKKIITAIPTLSVVAAHMGGLQRWDEVEAVLCGLPIFFDTAAVYPFLSAEQFTRIGKRHGFDRILFGSDWPWFSPADTIKYIAELPIDDTDKEKIVFANARKLLGIETPLL